MYSDLMCNYFCLIVQLAQAEILLKLSSLFMSSNQCRP